MRSFIIPGYDPHKLWMPRSITGSVLDELPKCMRCTKRTGITQPIEAYWIEDQGDHRVEVVGRCRGTCDNLNNDPTEHPNLNGHDNWHDAVRITWPRFSDGKTEEMMERDLVRQINSIKFFDDSEHHFDTSARQAA